MSIVERTVVVPKQDEVVEITLSMTQAQANKVRTLLGRVAAGDNDVWKMYTALFPVTAKLTLAPTKTLGIFKFS